MPMKFSFLAGLFVSVAVHAQPYELVKIDEGNAFNGPEEPTICISSKRPGVIAAGANINKWYYSHDSGRTWQGDELTSRYGVWGDPCIISPPNGKFVFFHLSDPTGENWQSDELLDRIVSQRSNKMATKWKKGRYTGLNPTKDQDKEWAVVDPNSGNIYVTWTQFDAYNSKEPGDSTVILFSRSKNGGRSWSDPVRINQHAGNCLDDDMTVEGAVPAVGPEGEVYVTWAWNEKLYFNKSSDEGETWNTKDKVVAEQPGGWVQEIPGINRCNGMPVTLVDRSNGPNRGTIYVNWTDQRFGESDTDVWVCWSKDGGATWSEPVRVNNDKREAHQFFTWMDIDQETGSLYCIFYDRRNQDGRHTDVFMASSTDGGSTWKNEQLNKEAFVPNKLVFFGDYTNIDVKHGMVRPIWTSYMAGKLSIWTALIPARKPQE